MKKQLLILLLLFTCAIAFSTEGTPITTQNIQININKLKDKTSSYDLFPCIKEISDKHDQQNAEKDSCDILTFLNGDIINAKVLKINKDNIHYKKCSEESEKTYIAQMSDIFMIQYYNGKQETISQEHYPLEIKKKKKKKKRKKAIDELRESDYDLIAIVGFLCGFFLTIFGVFVVFGFKKGRQRKAFLKGWLIGISILVSLNLLLSLIS